MSHYIKRIPLTRFRAFRFLVQLSFLVLVNLGIFGVADTFLTIPINYPHSPYGVVTGTIYVLQRFLTMGIFPFFPIAVFLLVGAVMGRAFCAWACPFGLVQDLASLVPINKLQISRNTNKGLRQVGELLVVVIVLVSTAIGFSAIIGGTAAATVRTALMFFSEEPWAVLDPAATLFGFLPAMFVYGLIPTDLNQLSVMDPIVWVRLAILVGSVGVTLFVPRAWCRWICPTGAILGRISKHSLLGVHRHGIRCTRCGDCEKACPMGIRLLDHEPGKLQSEMCTLCLDCVDACPENALQLRFLR